MSNPGPNPTRRRRGRALSARIDKVTEAILKAAEEEFATRGFGGARSRRIAELAQVNKATPFFYFKSKGGLYREVLERAIGRLCQLVLQALGPNGELQADKTAELINGLFALISEDPHWFPLVLRGLVDDPERVRQASERFLARSRPEGSARLPAQSLLVAASAVAQVLGYFLLMPLLAVSIQDPAFGAADSHSRQQMVLEMFSRLFASRGS